VKIDIFCEVQKARESWGENHEHTLIQETLEQARLADELGYGCWWEVEHHAAPIFSMSSAPEIMLTAIACQTTRLRVGHAAVLAPFKFNHPIRVAERTAYLDHISKGRLEVGLARSTVPEWRTFNIDPDESRDQMQETFEMLPRMWTEDSFSWKSANFDIREREIVPKPYQKPHPNLWQATATPSGFQQAGHNGVGALLTTVNLPLEAIEAMLAIYREEIRNCEPVGKFVNDQVALFTFVHCAKTEQEAIDNGAAAAAAWYVNTVLDFFEIRENTLRAADELAAAVGSNPNSPLAEYARMAQAAQDAPKTEATRLLDRMSQGEHITNEEAYEILNKQDSVIIGDIDTCRRKMRRYQEIGLDRLMCFQQVGNLPPEAIKQSMRLVGEHLIREFDPDHQLTEQPGSAVRVQ
jgi:alkanesulfonate monooxygenase SsuD/methylene tetrahydromethanopterin reductase-like flavin-dependent oxidoreductase (luciferase family)